MSGQRRYLTGEQMAADIGYLFDQVTFALGTLVVVMGVFTVVRVAEHHWFSAAFDGVGTFVWAALWLGAHRRAAKYQGFDA